LVFLRTLVAHQPGVVAASATSATISCIGRCRLLPLQHLLSLEGRYLLATVFFHGPL
jgi:hypothetical protein